MTSPVSPADWQAVHSAFRAEEKALTKQMDALAARRRALPRMEVGDSYRFQTPSGEASVRDLFEGRRQLIVYHHMLTANDPAPCAGCSMVADQITHLAHLHARDTSFTMVSRAPLAEIEAFKARMGWNFPWVETRDDFNADHGVTGGFGINVFLADGGRIWRTYFTSGRGVEMLGTVWSLLDITPFGRQESWQDAPNGTPQSDPYQWWRLHDQYAPEGA